MGRVRGPSFYRTSILESLVPAQVDIATNPKVPAPVGGGMGNEIAAGWVAVFKGSGLPWWRLRIFEMLWRSDSCKPPQAKSLLRPQALLERMVQC